MSQPAPLQLATNDTANQNRERAAAFALLLGHDEQGRLQNVSRRTSPPQKRSSTMPQEFAYLAMKRVRGKVFRYGELVLVGVTSEVDLRPHWESRFARTPADPVEMSFELWKQRVTENEETTWSASFIDANSETAVDLPNGFGLYGAPLASIAAVLNDYSQQGWKIEHVSEDRGLFAGPVAPTDAYPTRLRVMLSR